MLGKEQIVQLRDTVGAYPEPVLSLYAHVNPASTDNHPHAIALRVKETLRRLGVPQSLQQTVTSHFRQQVVQAKTLVVFADEKRMDTLGLEVELPVVHHKSGHLEARWGKAYFTPLLLAVDEFSRYGVWFVDQDRWRFFEVYLGEIAEREQAFRAPSPAERDEWNSSPPRSPEWLANRGGCARDNADWHVRELTRRFYEQAVDPVARHVSERGIGRLILMGQSQHLAVLEKTLPRALLDRVVGHAPPMEHAEFTAAQVLAKTKPQLDQIEAEAETTLLNRIREDGHWGYARCLDELQNGRLHTVVLPWDEQRQAWLDPATGRLHAVSDSETEAPAATQQTGTWSKKNLMEVLPELVLAHGARLEFVRGTRSERLMREFDGMAGLPRW